MLTTESGLECKVGTGRSHGTFGELLQGILPDGKSFMVTFPINLYSRAIFTPDFKTSKVVVTPKEKIKVAMIVNTILEEFSISIGGTVEICSEIPEGKGLASSSADLVAAAYALRDAFSLSGLDSTAIASLIKQIEPTDGVMYPGSSAFYYKDVELKESLAHLPPLVVVGVDEGNTLDTLEYNQRAKEHTKTCALQYDALLHQMSHAVRDGDLFSIGSIATKSAIMNQRHNFKPSLEKVIALSERYGALGTVIAHSGTFIGVLLDPKDPKHQTRIAEVLEAIEKMGKKAHIFHSLEEKVHC